MLIVLSILAAVIVIFALFGFYIACVLARDAWRDHQSVKRFQRHVDYHRSNGKLY